jgi:hypothetical protein
MEEDNMAIEVIIKRRVKQGSQAKKLVPLILQMRALAMHQPGYISGTTLCNLERPEDCLVISRLTIGRDGFIAAKELKWRAKSRHWLRKKQNTMFMPQWCPEPAVKKQLAGKLIINC